MLTLQYDNQRDAHNGYETLLTATGLTSGTVKLSKPAWSPLAVDVDDLPTGQTVNPIYTQPLYVSQIQIGSAIHNMVVAETLNDTIYAWDADNGAVLWKRQGTTQPAGENSLWFDDCGVRGSVDVRSMSPSGAGQPTALPFVGVVATPVIDTTSTPARMYVGSFCRSSNDTKQWWLHEISLLDGHDIAKVQFSGSVPVPGGGTLAFHGSEELLRAALLEVRIPGANPNHIIYAAFGTGVTENSASNPYHGWVFGYTTSAGGALSQVFAFATTPASEAGNTGFPPCNSTITDGFQNAPNWCGHGGGIWMSGRGPAAGIQNGMSHAYFGVGNGGFQANGLNWGESVLDFRLSTQGADSTPSDSFTPSGGVPVQPPLENGVAYTNQTLNENDWDMSVSGFLLFSDTDGNHRVVTVDKAGYGYVFNQGHLGGFEPGDPGNVFPFGASHTPCTVQAAECDRVASLAYYDNALYFWPYKERLVAFQSYSSSTNLTGTGTITSEGATVTGTHTDFIHQLVVGDTLVAGGQTVIVTSITTDTITVSPPFSPDVMQSGFTYNGLFVNPRFATVPVPATAGYPGGTMVISSNGTTPGSGIVWAVGTQKGATQVAHGPGALYAYDAATLAEIWTSPDTFIVSAFALPTVVNGNIYIPTYDQGILVYTGTSQ